MAEVYLVFRVLFVLRTCADRVRAHAAVSDFFPVCSFLVLLLLSHGYSTRGSSQHAVRNGVFSQRTARAFGVVSHQQERFLQYLQESALRYVRKAISQYKRHAAVTKSPSCFFQGVGKGDVTSLHTSVLWLGCASLCGNWVLWVDQRVGCSVCRTIVNML